MMFHGKKKPDQQGRAVDIIYLHDHAFFKASSRNTQHERHHNLTKVQFQQFIYYLSNKTSKTSHDKKFETLFRLILTDDSKFGPKWLQAHPFVAEINLNQKSNLKDILADYFFDIAQKKPLNKHLYEIAIRFGNFEALKCACQAFIANREYETAYMLIYHYSADFDADGLALRAEIYEQLAALEEEPLQKNALLHHALEHSYTLLSLLADKHDDKNSVIKQQASLRIQNIELQLTKIFQPRAVVVQHLANYGYLAQANSDNNNKSAGDEAGANNVIQLNFGSKASR